ncbi:MAG: O-antigen ligase family protein [Acidobacteriota bacterium]
MAGFLIESGVYFLLLFTPFAFGGVELWAQGVLQIVTGIIVFAWILGRSPTDPGRPMKRAPVWALGVPIGLFALLAVLQLIPMPSSWVRTLSPGTYDLYAASLPGYTAGEGFTGADLVDRIVRSRADEIPAPRGRPPGPPPANASTWGGRFLSTMSPWRTLSLYPGVTLKRLTLFLCYMALFSVVAGYFRTRGRQARLMTTCALSAFALTVLGIAQKLTWNGALYWVRQGEYENVFGPFVNRNSYAAFAGTIAPIGVVMSLEALRQVRQKREGAMARLLFWGFVSATIAGGVCLSLSRGGILAMALSMILIACMLIYFGRKVPELSVLLLVAVLCVGFLAWIGPEAVVERIGTLSEGRSVPAFAARTQAWERTIPMIQDHPAFGTGLGTFRYAFLRYAPPGERWWTTAHNEYLEVLCDTGIVGTVVFLMGAGAFVFFVARPGRFRHRSARYLYMGLVSGIAGLLVHSAVSSNLQVPANGLLLVVLSAALLRLVVDHGPRGGAFLAPPPRDR